MLTPTDYPKLYGYGMGVKISGWQDWNESHPLDNPKANATGRSHYRSLGQGNAPFIPKTSTQELFESGLQRRIHRTIARKQINFETYPLKDLSLRLDSCEIMADQGGGRYMDTTTTYQDNFKPKMPMAVKEDLCNEEADPLWNRIPKCSLEYHPSSEYKFMDDQLVARSRNRKKIDFFRQIRNSSNVFHCY